MTTLRQKECCARSRFGIPRFFFFGENGGRDCPMSSRATCPCRVVQLVHVESCNLSMPSRTTCPCRVVQLVHAASCNLSMPRRATCPCRVVRLVHAGSYGHKKEDCASCSQQDTQPVFCHATTGQSSPSSFPSSLPPGISSVLSSEDAFPFSSKILLSHTKSAFCMAALKSAPA